MNAYGIRWIPKIMIIVENQKTKKLSNRLSTSIYHTLLRTSVLHVHICKKLKPDKFFFIANKKLSQWNFPVKRLTQRVHCVTNTNKTSRMEHYLWPFVAQSNACAKFTVKFKMKLNIAPWLSNFVFVIKKNVFLECCEKFNFNNF
jgi:hypothetical protein